MKNNHIAEGTTKFLYMAVEILVACIVIGFLMQMAWSASKIGQSSAGQLESFNKELMESEITKYDGLVVSGSDVVNFLKKYLNDYSGLEKGPFTIVIVNTSNSTSHVNNEKIANTIDFTSNYYIKPTGKFLGSVEKNKNGVITIIKFVVQ